MSEHFTVTNKSAIALYEQREGVCRVCGAPVTEFKYAGREWSAATCDACTERAEIAAHAAADKLQREVRLEELDVPALYEDVTLETFQHHGDEAARLAQGRVLQLARRYLADWSEVPQVVVMQGAPGTGKGHVLWSIARVIAGTYGERVRVEKLSDVIRDLRASWDGGGDERKPLRHYRSPALLVIDEVSRHAFFGQPQQHLYDLIDFRTERLRPTIITTNETIPALAELLGPALMSRCMGSGSVWQFGAADYRIHQGKLLKEQQV